METMIITFFQTFHFKIQKWKTQSAKRCQCHFNSSSFFSTSWICTARAGRFVASSAARWWRTSGTCAGTTSRITERRSRSSRGWRDATPTTTLRSERHKRQRRHSLRDLEVLGHYCVTTEFFPIPSQMKSDRDKKDILVMSRVYNFLIRPQCGNFLFLLSVDF